MPPRSFEILNTNQEENYTPLRAIAQGKGCFNDGIRIVRSRRNGQLYVQKKIKAGHAEITGRAEMEILQHLQREANNPNIIRCADAFIVNANPSQASLFFEYCELGDLRSLTERFIKYNKEIINKKEKICEGFVWHVFLSLTAALTFLHWGVQNFKKYKATKNWLAVLHRDIKPDNIFLRPPIPGDLYPTVVLGDFGLATKQTDSDFTTAQLQGTAVWQPPEVPKHSFRGDVWSVGAVIHYLCHLGRGPVAPTPIGWDDWKWSLTPKARQPLPLSGFYSSYLARVVAYALTLDRDSRPDSDDLKCILIGERRNAKGENPEIFTRRLPNWLFKDYVDVYQGANTWRRVFFVGP